MSDIEKVGILGAGVMATGIAHLLAEKGIKVTVWNRKTPERVLHTISGIMDERTARGETSRESKSKILSNMRTVLSIGELAGEDVVIECIGENVRAKQDILKQIDGDCRFIATNTSSISITDIAEGHPAPEKIIGLHFFNPPIRRNFAEIIYHEKTGDSVIEECRDFCSRLDFQYILVPDKTGSVVNRILCAMLNEASRIYSENREYISCNDIDTAMIEGAAHGIGPFALADFIGVDICHAMMRQFGKRFPGQTFLPDKAWERVTEESGKREGRKKGFYS